MTKLCILVFGLFLAARCPNQSTEIPQKTPEKTPAALVEKPSVRVAAERLEIYLPKILGKKIGLVVNQTSLVGQTHLADTLIKRGVEVVKIFAPEHGFRGSADAGETVKNGRDAQTGLPIFSLYGKNKKPTAADFESLDLVIFDIQDVGARFYTYISTLFYVEQACAELAKPLLVLDRPNPNGHFFDGPMLENGFESFVGITNLPVVHGCTVGELAKLFAGENLLKVSQPIDLEVVKCQNYDHRTFYELPVAPSPNLPTMRSIYLYPSLCFFEGTEFSVGRGTDFPFEVVGHPDFPATDPPDSGRTSFSFVPKPNFGNQKPFLEGQKCFGYDFRKMPLDSLRANGKILLWPILDAFQKFPVEKRGSFFLKNNFFDKLAGSSKLRKQILAGKTETEIRASWQADLEKFGSVRRKYLLY